MNLELAASIAASIIGTAAFIIALAAIVMTAGLRRQTAATPVGMLPVSRPATQVFTSLEHDEDER